MTPTPTPNPANVADGRARALARLSAPWHAAMLARVYAQTGRLAPIATQPKA